MIWTERAYVFGRIEYNFGDGVWRAERSLLIFHGAANSPFNVTIGDVTLQAVTDAAGDVMIDLTDLLATYQIGDSDSVRFNTGDLTPTESVSFEIKGDLSPNSIIIPPNGEIGLYAPIIAPAYFLQGLWGINPQFVVHVGQSVLGYLEYVEYVGGMPTAHAFHPNDLQAVSVAREKIAFRYREDDELICSRMVNIRPEQCGRRYAMVQWVSAFGLIKRHTFEVRDVETSVSNSVSLQNNFGGFRELKGTRKGLRLHLSQLSAYDYWYYSDIVTSRDVRVAVSDFDADFGEDTRVKVTTKSVTIPNGVNIADFDVDVILKDYGII